MPPLCSDDVETDAIERGSYCATALRALDTFEAFLDPRVLVKFREECAAPLYSGYPSVWYRPQRLREKLLAEAYSPEHSWCKPLYYIFESFGGDPLTDRRHIARALYWLLNAYWCVERFGPTENSPLEGWQSEVKELEPEYIAEQEARAARATSHAAAPAAAAASASDAPAASASSSAGPTAAATLPSAVSAASLGAALLRQHESSIALLRYAEQLERDKAQLAGEKAKLSRAIERLTQEQADLQRQFKELAEQAAKLPQLQATVRQKDVDVAEARRLRKEADAAAAKQAEQSRRSLASVQQQLVQMEDELKQQTAAATRDAADARRQLEAQTKVNQQLQRERAQVDQKMERLRQSNGQLTQDKAQLEQSKKQLQRQLDERAAELATAQSQITAASAQTEQRITVKLEKLVDAQVDKHEQAAGKRKAEEERESEAKRRRTAEGKLAELSEQMDEKDKCIVCLDKQPDVLFLRCRHLACCGVCADSLKANGAAGAKCPQCQVPLAKKDIVKVFRA
jgi:hypothetical protein